MSKGFRWRALAVTLLAVVALVGLSACKSDTDKVTEAVSGLLESYVVPVANEDGEMPEDPAWPASDFGDADTMAVLEGYGVNADEWHEHCFKNFGYEIGEVSVDGDTATASVTVTNASLSAAVEAAGADFATFAQSADSQETYRQGGKTALFEQLVSYVYAHLDANESPVVTTLTITCTKDDEGNWAPQIDREPFFSALYGGSDIVAGLAAAAEPAAE